MEFLTNHAQIYDLLLHYKYSILIPATIIEGPLVMLISGFFIKLGYLSLIPAYIFLMTGDLIADIFWYGIGYYYGERFVNKFGRYVSISTENVETVKKIFRAHDIMILVVSKLTMGLGFALVTLVTAGMVKVPFKKYVILNAGGQFIWTGILLGIGFALGKFYLTINSIIGKVTMVAFFLIIFFCLIGFGKYMKARMTAKHLQ